jgi:hypothetical protein
VRWALDGATKLFRIQPMSCFTRHHNSAVRIVCSGVASTGKSSSRFKFLQNRESEHSRGGARGGSSGGRECARTKCERWTCCVYVEYVLLERPYYILIPDPNMRIAKESILPETNTGMIANSADQPSTSSTPSIRFCCFVLPSCTWF